MCIFRERKKSLLDKVSSTGRIRFYMPLSRTSAKDDFTQLNTNTSRHDQHLIEFPEVASLQSVSLLSIIIHLMNKFFDFFLISSRSGKRSSQETLRWLLLVVTRMDRPALRMQIMSIFCTSFANHSRFYCSTTTPSFRFMMP